MLELKLWFLNYYGAVGQVLFQLVKYNGLLMGILQGMPKRGGNLTFVTVLKAGHLVQYNQSVNVKDMLLRFINGAGLY
jgi:carboxypeptidase C (cathepsin A)